VNHLAGELFKLQSGAPFEHAYVDAAAFKTYIDTERGRWAEVIRKANIKVD
jgi:hypothetical protein